MRIAVCDVCGAQQSLDDPMIEMTIPGEFMDEETAGYATKVDVCSWNCVSSIVRGAFDEKPEEAPEDTDQNEKLVIVPQKKKEPTVGDLSAEELAKYTEQVTGVRRRY